MSNSGGFPFPIPVLPAADPAAAPLAPADPALRARMMSMAPMLGAEEALFFADFADANAEGKRRKWVRVGIGAAGGLALGVILAKVL